MTTATIFKKKLESDFGQSSGSLISQKWLTPQALEECTLFWDDGFRVLMRDLFRSYFFSKHPSRYGQGDWVALGWLVTLALTSSLIFLPLLLPLINVALPDAVAHFDHRCGLPHCFARKCTIQRVGNIHKVHCRWRKSNRELRCRI